MKSPLVRFSIAFVFSLFLLMKSQSLAALGQEAAETFCVIAEPVDTYTCPFESCKGYTLLSPGITVYVVETDNARADTGEGVWSYIRHRNEFSFVYDLQCTPMETLWAEAQPLIDQYTAALEVDPTNVEAMVRRGEAYHTVGEMEQALADFEQAIALQPDYGPAYSNRTWVYADMGRVTELIEVVMPSQPPPEGLYDPAVGMDLFEEIHTVFTVNDWYFVYFPVQSFVSIPAGWQAIDTATRGFLQYSMRGDYENPDVLLTFTILGYEGDDRTSAEAAADLEGQLSAQAGWTILTSDLIDEHSGYFLVEVEDPRETPHFALFGFSEALNYGWFHVVIVQTWGEGQWSVYFPIFQIILEHLVTSDLSPASIRLPDSLIDPTQFTD